MQDSEDVAITIMFIYLCLLCLRMAHLVWDSKPVTIIIIIIINYCYFCHLCMGLTLSAWARSSLRLVLLPCRCLSSFLGWGGDEHACVDMPCIRGCT